MTLMTQLERMESLITKLEQLAHSGFQNGTEPAQVLTEVSNLRTEFGLITSALPTLTPKRKTELETDLEPILIKLEKRLTVLVQPKTVRA
jgi:hypothetical protein